MELQIYIRFYTNLRFKNNYGKNLAFIRSPNGTNPVFSNVIFGKIALGVSDIVLSQMFSKRDSAN
eukprot:UN23557